MEISASRVSEKKDKMDGNGFGDLLKKPWPSETRASLHTFPSFHAPMPIDIHHHDGRVHYEAHALHTMHSPAALNPSPIISDISLIRLSGADSPFSPPHPYVSAHVEQYLRSVHGGSALSMMSAARGLTPAQLCQEQLKEHTLFGLHPAAPGSSPAEFYHLMTGHRGPYGNELLMSGGGATGAAHLTDYITPIDGGRGGVSFLIGPFITGSGTLFKQFPPEKTGGGKKKQKSGG